MGVYIDMEIPISCANCPLRCYDRDDQKFCGATGNAIRYELSRPENCPLIEIPEPHGRLGDLDDIIKRAKKWIDHPDKYISQRNKDMIYILEREDAIIPASDDASHQQVTANWYKPTGMMPPEFTGRHRCSACDGFAMHDWKHHREHLTPFCPHCGAKMENGDSEL